MTATGSPSHDESCGLVGFGSFLREPLDLQFPGLPSHHPKSQVGDKRLTHRCQNRYCTYWWWRPYPCEIQGLCGHIQQRYCRDCCTAPANSPHDRPGTRSHFTIRPNLLSFGSRVENSWALYQKKRIEWIHAAMIRACGSTDYICKKEGWRLTTVCGLPSSQ